ncbi:hypothetical protein ACS0TY_034348 [Phlomoides rotata]
MLLLYKQKKNKRRSKGNRLLISVTVLGSAGPIRFVVNEEEIVAAVIDTTLKSYAREGRLPVLGSHLDNFILYCPLAGTEALPPLEKIGSFGARYFVLCKKPEKAVEEEPAVPRKGAGIWKSWFHKPRNLRISSH